MGSVAGVYIAENHIDYIYADPDDDHPGTKPPVTRDRKGVAIERDGMPPVEFLKMSAQQLSEDAPGLESLVIGCFGPFETLEGFRTKRMPSNYGKLGNVSNYPEWKGVHVYDIFKNAFTDKGLEPPLIQIYTDVDVAAYGEYWFRAVSEEEMPGHLVDSSLIFLNFSKSVNGGIAFNGHIWEGRLHPLMSVIRPGRFSIKGQSGDILTDNFTGCCPYHGDCIEGLIGADVLAKRMGYNKFEEIPYDPAYQETPSNEALWNLFSYYAASLCVTVTGVLAPSRIVIGGKVIREQTDYRMAQYLLRKIRGHFYDYIERSIDGDMLSSPRYKEVLDVDRFISLPQRPKNRTRPRFKRVSKPGCHGALRLAARNFSLQNRRG